MVGAARDQVAPGVGAGEAHRARGRVRAVLAELDHLGAVDQRQEALRARHLERRGAGEVAAAHQLAPRRVDHRGIGVAEPDRAVAHAVLDVLPAVGVPHPAAEPARDEPGRQDRVLVVALGVGVAAARDQVMGHVPQARRYPMPVHAHCMLRASAGGASRPSLHGSSPASGNAFPRLARARRGRGWRISRRPHRIPSLRQLTEICWPCAGG